MKLFETIKEFFQKKHIGDDYFWLQTLGTLGICWNWLSVGWGNQGGDLPWFILQYPMNLVSEAVGVGLWVFVAWHWKNLNVFFLKSYILIMSLLGVYHFYM